MQKRLKKILCWFIPEIDKDYESPMLRKDEEGKYLFYPWGYPGEASYVDKKQRIQIIIYFGFLSFCFCIFGLGYIYADINNLKISNTLNSLYLTMLTFFPAFYICSLYLFTRGARFYIVPRDKRLPPNKRMVWIWFFVSCFHVVAIITAFGDRSIAFIALNMASLILISYVFMKIRRTKGYYFAE